MHKRLIPGGTLAIVLFMATVQVGCAGVTSATPYPTASPLAPPLVEVTHIALPITSPQSPDLFAFQTLAPTPGPPHLEFFRQIESGPTFHTVALSPDGAYLLVGLEQVYTLFDAETLAPLWSVERGGVVAGVGWAVARRELYLQFQGRLETYGLLHGRRLRVFTSPEITSDRGHFSPDGTLALIGPPERMTLIDLVQGEVLRSYVLGHDVNYWQIAWHPGGESFTYADTYGGGLDICAVDLSGGCQPSPVMGQLSAIRWVMPGPDGRLAVVGYADPAGSGHRARSMVGVWEVIERRELASWQADIDVPQRVQWMPDGRTFALWYAGRRTLYEARSGAPLAEFAQGSGDVFITADRELIITEFGSEDALDGPAQVVSLYAWGIGGLLVAPAGPSDLRIIQSTPHAISRWDARTGREAHIIASGFTARPTEAVFSPDGRKVAVKVDGRWIIWPLDGGSIALPLADSRRTGSLVWFPDGDHVAALQGSEVLIWAVGHDDPIRRLQGNGSFLAALDISPDGRRIAAGSADGSILIWDPWSGERLRTYRASGSIYHLAWSSDNHLLAALYQVDEDASLLVWNPSSDRFGGSLTGLDRRARLSWADGGKPIVMIAQSPYVLRWDVSEDTPTRHAMQQSDVLLTTLTTLPGGQFLAYAPSRRTIGWWDGASGHLRAWMDAPVEDDVLPASVIGLSAEWVGIARAGLLELWRVAR